MSKKSKTKYYTKKTQLELEKYRDFIEGAEYSSEETVALNNTLLQGTEDFNAKDDEETNVSNKIKKKPIKYIVFDWMKNHVIGGIIIAIATAFITSYASAVKNIATLQEKISHIENQIENIQESNVNKDVLDLELENIKKEIDSSFLIPLNDIEWKIKLLEEKVDKLRDNN